MAERRPAAKRRRDLTNGPGKLTQAFGIDGPEWHGRDLTQPPLYFAEGHPGEPAPRIATSTRIGLTRGVEYPWRYFIQDHPYVSPGTPSDIAQARKKAKKRRG
jgi:DNA-3-methyladenine glycosylase